MHFEYKMHTPPLSIPPRGYIFARTPRCDVCYARVARFGPVFFPGGLVITPNQANDGRPISDDVERISNALATRGWRRRRGKDGRLKLRGQCLFHDDPTASADFYYDDDPWYYCHGCAESFGLDEVLAQLGLEKGLGQPTQVDPVARPAQAVRQEFHYHSRFGFPTAVYTYQFPDGRISHYKLRFALDGKKKTFAMQDAQGQWRKPEPIWPIY